VEDFMDLIIKGLLAGLTGVSLCMANISGIVTDTGTTPIAGVVVQLEKGGQTATTGSDGRFTLSVVGTTILHGKSTSIPNGLSAGIAGNLMTITIAQRSAIEVATFDLNGKWLTTVRKTLDAGSHSLSLPYRGAGIYLYKVNAGNSEFVLKGTAVGGISSGSSATSQGSSLKPLAKQAMITASYTIDDAIAATKTGYLNYRCVQYNSDTTGLKIKMIASAGTVTDTDGNIYQTVRIGNQIWTVENLRVTRYNDGTAIALVTDSTAWANIYNNNLTTPAYCYYTNMTNTDSIKKWGGALQLVRRKYGQTGPERLACAFRFRMGSNAELFGNAWL
jgi:Fibrobacter succinogenes major domain (Fib_succ_major).